jgi:hypothetical protein
MPDALCVSANFVKCLPRLGKGLRLVACLAQGATSRLNGSPGYPAHLVRLAHSRPVREIRSHALTTRMRSNIPMYREPRQASDWSELGPWRHERHRPEACLSQASSSTSQKKYGGLSSGYHMQIKTWLLIARVLRRLT